MSGSLVNVLLLLISLGRFPGGTGRSRTSLNKDLEDELSVSGAELLETVSKHPIQFGSRWSGCRVTR